jgi:glucose-6-phosphate isomerase
MEFNNLTATAAFKGLRSLEPFDIRTGLNAARIRESSIPAGGGLTFNWAAMPVGKPHIATLIALAEEQQLVDKYVALASGEIMNTGEHRMVLHHLTRGNVLGNGNTVVADGEDKEAFYRHQLDRIATFSGEVRSGRITGSTGKRIETVVQIGIGGSDLGPRALYLALKGWCAKEGVPHIEARFISNVDPDDPTEVLSGIDMEKTLFILVSKSGTTQETLTNQEFVLEAMRSKHIVGLKPEQHMVAVTSKTSPLSASAAVLEAFFIDDYIGGRYSSTSAVGGVVLSLAFGFDVFKQLLDGAHDADLMALNRHPLRNAAMFDALLGVYLRNVVGKSCTAILPYSQALSRFPAHLQQLDMESNGKQVNRFGEPLDYCSGPVVFGEPGTNGQHSFYQLLHQGTESVPLQFIGFSKPQRMNDLMTDGSTSQQKLVANLIAQIVAFACGKDHRDANRRFEGNRWSSLLLADRLTARTLGALLAHYENKVMFQGFLWNVNSFDQEGVQLGKVLAKQVLNGGGSDEVLKAYIALMG